jgi:hypothetical protein
MGVRELVEWVMKKEERGKKKSRVVGHSGTFWS